MEGRGGCWTLCCLHIRLDPITLALYDRCGCCIPVRMLFPCVCCTASREVRGPYRIPQTQSNTFTACVRSNWLIYYQLIRLVHSSVCLPFSMLNSGKDASLSGMEHDQLVVLVKGTVCNSLTEKWTRPSSSSLPLLSNPCSLWHSSRSK